MKYKAFSLIELLVVVAIIAILAAIAVPMYKTYSVKAKIVNIMSLMDECAAEIIKTHQISGNWPAQASCFGYTMNVGAGNWAYPTSLNTQGIYQIYYDTRGTDLSVTITTTGLSAMGTYTDATACPGGGNGCNNLIRNIYRDNGTSVTMRCGLDVPVAQGPWSVPLQFMPPNCTCTNINSYFGGGNTC